MDRLKTLCTYIIIIILIYVFVSLTSNTLIKTTYASINEYEILTTIPKIEVVESKVTSVNGYVKARLINDTGIHITKVYVKLDLYSKNDNYLGTKYFEIRNLLNNEVEEVVIDFKFNDVEKYKISTVDKIEFQQMVYMKKI